MHTTTLSRVNVQRPPMEWPAVRLLRLREITCEHMGRSEYRVADRFAFWPATDYWRALDGSKWGYTITKLIEAVQTTTATA